MAKRREKGKIPHTEWPAIRMRHAAGESLASIARDYGCTGPAIRYIVNRPVEADGEAPAPAPKAEVRDGDPSAAEPARPPPPAISPGAAAERAPEAPGIDPDLRWRVSSEIASFLAVFDSFLTDDSPETYDQLLAATDRLMRVAARTRIELERARASEHSRLRQARSALRGSRVASA